MANNANLAGHVTIEDKAILSGLALIGVLWVGWSQRALARNQVELAALIQRARRTEE